MILVLDACATLHAKQLAHDGGDPLELLGTVGAAGARFVTTPRVCGEQLSMSLSKVHQAWREADWFEVQRVSVRDRRQARNRLKRGAMVPGDKDVGLVALASRLDAVLLTHDNAAAGLAAHCDVISVDLLDLAAVVCARELWTWERAEATLSSLGRFAWRPHDWQGGVRATLDRRPQRDRLVATLSAMLP